MIECYFLCLRKSSLSAAWKTRLQGLLVGLAVAAIAVGITLAVFLTSNLSFRKKEFSYIRFNL